MTRLGRFLALPASRRRTLVHAALLLTASRVLLALTGLDRTRRFLSRSRDTREDRVRAEELARAMLTAAHNLPFTSTCLDRAVALWWLLSRNGIRAALRIGVRLAPLAAHAWVEHEGEVLLDEEAAGFAPFDDAILASK